MLPRRGRERSMRRTHTLISEIMAASKRKEVLHNEREGYLSSPVPTSGESTPPPLSESSFLLAPTLLHVDLMRLEASPSHKVIFSVSKCNYMFLNYLRLLFSTIIPN
ncbi:hypothetical protein AB6A40_007090 [Gnathostoma spinigerum]|uniref:Uncharacterized protein n=1 Tax=Gnathostoma spinigerum TaxID=75299 RepID=A0ABD6ESE9_9BILA